MVNPNQFGQLCHPTGRSDYIGHVHTQFVGDSHLFCQAQSVGETHTSNFKINHKNPMEYIAERLRTLREQRKVTQVEVAVAVEIDRSSLSKYETGGDVPGRDTLMKLAEYYSVSIDWLASPPGQNVTSEAGTAKNQKEALMLWAFRSLPDEEADAHLNLLVSRAKTLRPSS